MISKEDALSICQNNIHYRVKLIFYNGLDVNCIPIDYDHYTDKIRIADLRDRNKDITVRRERIHSFKELNQDDQHYNIHNGISFSGEFAKKLIIIGAGASFGYSDSLTGERMSYRPPLANNLFAPNFDAILDFYQGAKNFASQASFTADIESFFQNHWNSLCDNDIYDEASVHSLISTQYYLSELFYLISKKQRGNRYNYYQGLLQLTNKYLASKGNMEKVLIVSFNYDLLLEEALTSFMQYTFSSIDEYIDYRRRNILLFKPHGSCNWFRKSKVIRPSQVNTMQNALQTASSYLFKNRINLGHLKESIESRVEIISDNSFSSGQFNFQHYPNLLVPFKDKDEFSMPNDHTQTLEYLLQKVEDVLILGWKGTEESFNKLLQRELNRRNVCFYYANHTDKTIETKFRKDFPDAQINEIKSFFKGENIEEKGYELSNFSNFVRYSTAEENFFFK